MATFRDWKTLAGTTIRSLNGRDVANLYEFEWPEARKTLLSEYSATLEADRNRVRRFLRSCSAIVYGLTKRLAPHRRVLFVVALLVTVKIAFEASLTAGRPTSLMIVVSFAIMSFLLALELLDKLKFRDELELARELQAGLLPHTLPELEQYELAAFNRIANTVGGDIYDFVALPDGRLAILFGDASGHGMTAGLVMAVAHAAFRTQLDIDPSPLSICGALNRILCRTGSSRSFFACAYVLVEPDGRYAAFTAGHPPVLVVERNGRIRTQISEGSYPLGIKATEFWKPLEGMLQDGESLLFFSDGLCETQNASGRDFGYDFVESIAGWNAVESSQELLDRLVNEWSSFSHNTIVEDDVSVAVVRRR